jgi:hypothetical protein
MLFQYRKTLQTGNRRKLMIYKQIESNNAGI